MKTADFEPTPARYIRLIALSEAGNRGPWSSAAEIVVYGKQGSSSVNVGFTPPARGKGLWGPTINFPIVPVSASIEPNSGKIVGWSSYSPLTFGGDGGKTVTAEFTPSTQTITQAVITNTGHDMFCVGISIDVNGRTIVTGGDSNYKTSAYSFGSDSW